MPMTQAERDAEDALTAAEKPMKDWLAQMAATDKDIPRAIEDIIDALDAPTRARIAPETLTKYQAKKTLRSQKP